MATEPLPAARRGGPAPGWSDNRAFLEFAEANADCREYASFAPLLHDNPFCEFLSLQPWPLFAEPADAALLAPVTQGLDRIIKSVPRRFFDNDPARLSAFYGSRPELMGLMVSEPDGVADAISRGDFLETEDGFQCLEWNSGSVIGGMGLQALEPLYLACPPVARFLAERGLRARHWNRLRAAFRNIVRSTLTRGPAVQGELNVAVLIHPNPPDVVAYLSSAGLEREFRAALAEEAPALDGQVFLCASDDLATSGGDGMFLGGRRVHAILEQQGVGKADFRPFHAFKRGAVNLFTGPVSSLLSDKCNLAVVSAHARSDEFTREERALIERHIPWTRMVADAPTRFGGRRLRVPEILARYRERMVIKKGRSASGKHVLIGREHGPAEWEALVARALADGGWIAQERVESRPYFFLARDGRVARHDVVWGLYACGELDGGTLLRLQPSEVGGIVNHARGAQVSLLLEVEPSA